ncbi:MAG: alpha/beta hydrolase [Tepidisphaeraceae bacterium]
MSLRPTILVLLCLLACAVGCSTGSKGTGEGVVLFIHGAGGDGGWYSGIEQGLRDAGEKRTIRSVHWGMPGPMFVMNFNDRGVHERAERTLAEVIARAKTAPIDLVAHSAGCGATLGALAQLPPDVHVRHIVLLSPSVSPTYDLKRALVHVESIDVFTSTNDTTFLKWRCSTFGTYDGVKTVAAGNCGFDVSTLSPAEQAKVHQHAWTEADKDLGNDGGHFGPTARKFVAARVSPVVSGGASPTP